MPLITPWCEVLTAQSWNPHKLKGRCVWNPPSCRDHRSFPILVMQAVGLHHTPWDHSSGVFQTPAGDISATAAAQQLLHSQPLGVMLIVHRGSSLLPICSEHPPAGCWVGFFFVCFNGQIRPVLTQSAPSLRTGCVRAQPQPARTSQHRCKLDAAVSEPWSVSFRLLILLQLKSSPWS